MHSFESRARLWLRHKLLACTVQYNDQQDQQANTGDDTTLPVLPVSNSRHGLVKGTFRNVVQPQESVEAHSYNWLPGRVPKGEVSVAVVVADLVRSLNDDHTTRVQS